MDIDRTVEANARLKESERILKGRIDTAEGEFFRKRVEILRSRRKRRHEDTSGSCGEEQKDEKRRLVRNRAKKQ